MSKKNPSENNNYTILIVDDQVDNISFLAGALEGAGYSITFALSGKEAPTEVCVT